MKYALWTIGLIIFGLFGLVYLFLAWWNQGFEHADIGRIISGHIQGYLKEHPADARRVANVHSVPWDDPCSAKVKVTQKTKFSSPAVPKVRGGTFPLNYILSPESYEALVFTAYPLAEEAISGNYIDKLDEYERKGRLPVARSEMWTYDTFAIEERVDCGSFYVTRLKVSR